MSSFMAETSFLVLTLGSEMGHVSHDGLMPNAHSCFSCGLLFTTLSSLFISGVWRFSLLGPFKHEMYFINSVVLEQKRKEFYLCLICCFTQDENNNKKKKQKWFLKRQQKVETMGKIRGQFQ